MALYKCVYYYYIITEKHVKILVLHFQLSCFEGTFVWIAKESTRTWPADADILSFFLPKINSTQNEF